MHDVIHIITKLNAWSLDRMRGTHVCHAVRLSDGVVDWCSAGVSSWVEVPTVLSGLLSLRIGLCNIHEVVLALPKLQHLDLNGCSNLRLLELRCPRLLTGMFQRISR